MGYSRVFQVRQSGGAGCTWPVAPARGQQVEQVMRWVGGVVEDGSGPAEAVGVGDAFQRGARDNQ